MIHFILINYNHRKSLVFNSSFLLCENTFLSALKKNHYSTKWLNIVTVYEGFKYIPETSRVCNMRQNRPWYEFDLWESTALKASRYNSCNTSNENKFPVYALNMLSNLRLPPSARANHRHSESLNNLHSCFANLHILMKGECMKTQNSILWPPFKDSVAQYVHLKLSKLTFLHF